MREQSERERDRIVKAMLKHVGPGRYVPAERLAPLVNLPGDRVRFHFDRLEQEGDVYGTHVDQELYPIMASLTGKGEQRAREGRAPGAAPPLGVVQNIDVRGSHNNVNTAAVGSGHASLNISGSDREQLRRLLNEFRRVVEALDVLPDQDRELGFQRIDDLSAELGPAPTNPRRLRTRWQDLEKGGRIESPSPKVYGNTEHS